jgi:hypothetical protein
MTTLLFLSAVSLSTIAAYYAIMGLMAIFSGAAMSIAIMGGALELSKLVVASWLYRNWKETSILLKTYFVTAIIVLMCLTSMGIFGYLSKAHSDQGMITGDVLSKIELIDGKIKYQKEIINDARATLDQLDQQIEKYTELGAVTRGVKARDSQRDERAAAYKTIEEAQAKVSEYTDQRIPLAQEARKVEAEIGPIRYIAALIYGEQTDPSFLEKAVRIVTLMIVGVFDPLAVLMFIGYNQTVMRSKEKEVETVPVVEEPEVEPEVNEVIAEVEVLPKHSIPEVKANQHLKSSDYISLDENFQIQKF